MEVIDSDKHSSLLRYIITAVEGFIGQDPWIKTSDLLKTFSTNLASVYRWYFFF